MRKRWLWTLAPAAIAGAVLAQGTLRPVAPAAAVPAGCADGITLFCADPSWPDLETGAPDPSVPEAAAPRLHALPP